MTPANSWRASSNRTTDRRPRRSRARMGRIVGAGVRRKQMVEFRYFNKEYKKVVNKTFSDTIVFFKDNWNDYSYYITFHVYYYGKMVMKDTLVVIGFMKLK